MAWVRPAFDASQLATTVLSLLVLLSCATLSCSKKVTIQNLVRIHAAHP
jgi:hypothetical protein